MGLWFSKSTKLSVASDSGILVSNSLIVSSAESNGMPVDNESKSKEIMHSFGLTVMFSVTTRNCAELCTFGSSYDTRY